MERMYAKEGGVHHVVNGQGKEGITLVDDGDGVVSVSVGQQADGKEFEIILQPHAGSAHKLVV